MAAVVGVSSARGLQTCAKDRQGLLLEAVEWFYASTREPSEPSSHPRVVCCKLQQCLTTRFWTAMQWHVGSQGGVFECYKCLRDAKGIIVFVCLWQSPEDTPSTWHGMIALVTSLLKCELVSAEKSLACSPIADHKDFDTQMIYT